MSRSQSASGRDKVILRVESFAKQNHPAPISRLIRHRIRDLQRHTVGYCKQVLRDLSKATYHRIGRPFAIAKKTIERKSVDDSASMERNAREPKWHPYQIYPCHMSEPCPVTLCCICDLGRLSMCEHTVQKCPCRGEIVDSIYLRRASHFLFPK